MVRHGLIFLRMMVLSIASQPHMHRGRMEYVKGKEDHGKLRLEKHAWNVSHQQKKKSRNCVTR